jgi:hypothetical protein
MRVGVSWFVTKKSNVQCDNVNAEMGKDSSLLHYFKDNWLLCFVDRIEDWKKFRVNHDISVCWMLPVNMSRYNVL